MTDATSAAVEAPRENLLDRPGWRLSLTVWAGLLAALFVLFWRDVYDLFMIWWRNATYQHCLLIPPIIAYLVWIRRDEVSQLTPRPFLPAAVLMLFGGLGWMLGELADVALVRQIAIIGLLIVSVPLVFGLTVARGLTFPLFYSIFLIPAGDQLIPWLQMITADICIFLLDLFNVPAYIDGVFIETPTGSFEVAEACSGVRFLIAMVAFSTLVAHLCFRTTFRRVVCVVSAVVLAILANGIRAWGTIYLAWIYDPSFAAGVDHVVYGWFFFAIIMAIVLGVGWFFFDRPVDDPAFDPKTLERLPRPVPPVKSFAIAAAAGLVATMVAPAYGIASGEREATTAIAEVALPDVPGWRKVESTGSGWRPLFDNATASRFQTYANAEGMRVDLFVGAYDRQSDDSEMVAYGNGLIEPGTDADWSWAQDIDAPLGGRGEQILHRPWVRDVWMYYIIGGEPTSSDYRAKLMTLERRLLGGRTDAGVVIISTERGVAPGAGQAEMRAFLDALGNPVDTYESAAGLD